jgi:hypothetical protein
VKRSMDNSGGELQDLPFAEDFEKEVAIIGGGMGGCMSAWVLAKAGWKVTILESASDLLLRSANQTPARMGLGFHYADEKTAEKYLRATINFMREFPGFLIGQNEPQSHYLKHGRYYISKDSQHPPDEIMKTYYGLKELYVKLVNEDPKNAVFGDPDLFFRVLYVDEYSDVVEASRVVKGIETCECLLNWPKFRSLFIEKLREHPNIKILLNTTVIEPKRSTDARFSLLCLTQDTRQSKKETSLLITPYVVNCSWQNSEWLDVQMGLKSEDNLNRSNRVKVLAKVKLLESSNMHSSFFLTGPHCMVSNMGDGTALMSYAPITNIQTFKDLKLPEPWAHLIDSKCVARDMVTVMPDILKHLQGQSVHLPIRLQTYLRETNRGEWDINKLLLYYYGSRIQEGVAQYIPKIKNSELIEVRFGIVKTRGDVDITNKNSAFHKRDYSGIEVLQCGWITNDLMKLLYGLDNAKEILGLLNHHYESDKQIVSYAKMCSGMAKEAFWAARDCSRRIFGRLEIPKMMLLTRTESSNIPSETEPNNLDVRQTNSKSTAYVSVPALRSQGMIWSQEYGCYDGSGPAGPSDNHGNNPNGLFSSAFLRPKSCPAIPASTGTGYSETPLDPGVHTLPNNASRDETINSLRLGSSAEPTSIYDTLKHRKVCSPKIRGYHEYLNQAGPNYNHGNNKPQGQFFSISERPKSCPVISPALEFFSPAPATEIFSSAPATEIFSPAPATEIFSPVPASGIFDHGPP